MKDLKERVALEAKALLEYRHKAESLDDLHRRVGELQETIDALDESIDIEEAKGNDAYVDFLCKQRNSLNLVKLELEITMHKFELQLAILERNRALTA